MQLIRNLHDRFIEQAERTTVTCLSVGLKYTAVQTDDGGMGIAFTHPDDRHCCSTRKEDYRDYESRPAAELLAQLESSSPLRRSAGLALVNALNYHRASEMPEDSSDGLWMDAFGINAGTRVAMVGYFRPLVKKFQGRGAHVEAIDRLQGIGEPDAFYDKLNGWADVLLMTSTSILNDSTESILERIGPDVKVVMLGPSTPMVPEAFAHLPVRLLAGTLPVDHGGVMKAIRHGEGTPVIHRFSRKICALLPENDNRQ